MKTVTCTALSLVLLAGAAVPAQAQSVLGGILGGKDDAALVTLGSGDAGSKGLVNVGLGGDNQLLDVQVGNNGGLATATVGSGGSNGLLDADVDLLGGTVGVGASVGGGSLADIDVTIGGGGDNGGGGNGGGNGNGGGGNGGGGNGGGNGGGGNGGGNGVALGAPSGGAACVGTPASQIERLIRSTRIDASWQRATDVSIRRVDICPELRSWLAAALARTGLGSSLQSAIAQDALLSASLSRSSYNASRVFAVDQSGRQLILYVY